MGKLLKIRKGKSYLCLKDLKTDGRSFEGKRVYVSDRDGFIEDDKGGSWHILADASHFREWRVEKDARDGDFLVIDGGTSVQTTLIFKGVDKGSGKVRYYFDSYFKGGGDGKYYGIADDGYVARPATDSEASDFIALLGECGYEWDSDNKKLKPIQDA